MRDRKAALTLGLAGGEAWSPIRCLDKRMMELNSVHESSTGEDTYVVEEGAFQNPIYRTTYHAELKQPNAQSALH